MGAGLLVLPFSSFSPPHWGDASNGAANAGATAARATEASRPATSVELDRRFMSASLEPRVLDVKLACSGPKRQKVPQVLGGAPRNLPRLALPDELSRGSSHWSFAGELAPHQQLLKRELQDDSAQREQPNAMQTEPTVRGHHQHGHDEHERP